MKFIESAKLPTTLGDFQIHAFEDNNKICHLAVTIGKFPICNSLQSKPILLRLHSECLTGDALFSMRCDCGDQLHLALKMLAEQGHGILLYLRQEGRGIGLANKIRTYKLQDCGADTIEANKKLGFAADIRDYSICLPILSHFNITNIGLMTNNLNKIKAFKNMGITVEHIPLKTKRNKYNRSYLNTKASKLNHLL